MNKLFTDVFATRSSGNKKNIQKGVKANPKPKPRKDVAEIHNKLHFMAWCLCVAEEIHLTFGHRFFPFPFFFSFLPIFSWLLRHK